MKKDKKSQGLFVVMGLLLLILGLLYYALFRDVTLLYLWYFPGVDWLQQTTSDIAAAPHFSWLDSLPSFLHVLALSYLSIGLIRPGQRAIFIWPVLWLLINLLFEFGQRYPDLMLSLIPLSDGFVLFSLYFLQGTFDWYDVFASILAFVIVSLHITIKMQSVPNINVSFFKRSLFMRLVGSGIFLFGIGSLMGTSLACRSDDDTQCRRISKTPVYLSYQELRRPVTISDQQILENIGKIYLYEHYLLVNSRNKGVHVFDNRDVNNPVPLGFIPVPGNIDIAVKNDYLYLDSYIDLVVVDLRDEQNIAEVHRIEGVFPYDPYQNIPEGIYLSGYDMKKGIVIGYEGDNNEN